MTAGKEHPRARGPASQLPIASISSRSAVWLCWLLLFAAVVFAPSQTRATFTKPIFQTPEVIALRFAPQLASKPRFKLEIGTGILCGNDPVNRHDPLGLASPPFAPDVFDQDAGAGLWNYQSTDPTFLLAQIAKAAQLNSWLDAQGAEIAAVQAALAGAQADAAALRNFSLQVPGAAGAMLGSMAFGSLAGGGNGGIRAAQIAVGSEIGQLRGQLNTLLTESQPWFDASGNLYGDLNGDGRAGRSELSRPFQTRVVSVGMHDQTFDVLNAVGVAQAGLVVLKALGALGTSIATRFAPRIAVAEGAALEGIQLNRVIGNATADAIAARYPFALREVPFTTVFGKRRVVDVLTLGGRNIAIESKVGRTLLNNPDVRRELARDWWLRRTGPVSVIGLGVNSQITSSTRRGPDAALLEMLKKLGFGVRQ